MRRHSTGEGGPVGGQLRLAGVGDTRGCQWGGGGGQSLGRGEDAQRGRGLAKGARSLEGAWAVFPFARGTGWMAGWLTGWLTGCCVHGASSANTQGAVSLQQSPGYHRHHVAAAWRNSSVCIATTIDVSIASLVKVSRSPLRCTTASEPGLRPCVAYTAHELVPTNSPLQLAFHSQPDLLSPKTNCPCSSLVQRSAKPAVTRTCSVKYNSKGNTTASPCTKQFSGQRNAQSGI